MKFLVIFFLDIFDFFYRLNLINFLKKNNINEFHTIFDIGAHKGESIKFFNTERYRVGRAEIYTCFIR